MTDTCPLQPDVLVLGGGGILGEAWMSALLTGLDEAEHFDARRCAGYLGTSAGSIVAASLASGMAPGSRLGALPDPRGGAPEEIAAFGGVREVLGAVAGIGAGAAAPFVSLALSSSSAGGALLRRTALRRVPQGTRSLTQLAVAVERSGASWDGRLRVAAVELETGRRVIFGSSGAPRVSVGAAVHASCAIPGVFRPVQVGGRSYVDGGAWSPTNLDAAEVRRGDVVLCLNPTGSFRAGIGSLSGAIGSISRGAASAEALALRHRGARVETINPDKASAVALGTNLMDPSRRGAVIAAGLAQGRRLARAELARAA